MFQSIAKVQRKKQKKKKKLIINVQKGQVAPQNRYLDISSLYLLCTFSVDGLYPIQRKYREGTSEIGGGTGAVPRLCRNKVPVDGE